MDLILERKTLHKPGWFLFAVLAAAAAVVPYLTAQVYFMEPDDYLINYIANGSYGFEGSAHIARYMRMPVGYFLKGLYHVTTAVNWYAWMLLSLIMAAFFCYDLLIWRRTRQIVLLILLTGMEVASVRWFFTYTVAAFLLGGAGMLLLYTALMEKKARYAAAASLFLWGCWCLRTDALFPAVAVGLPLAAAALYRQVVFETGHAEYLGKRFRPLRIPAVTFLLLTALLLGITQIHERWAYSFSPWRQQVEFDQARVRITDYPMVDYNSHQEAFERAGLSALDYQMICSWEFADRTVFTPKALAAAGNVITADAALGSRWSYMKTALQGSGWMIFLAPLLIYLALLILYRNCHWKSELAVLFITYLLFAALLVVRMRFVLRVSVPITFITAVMLFALADAKKKNRGRLVTAGALACAVLAGMAFIRQVNREFPYPKRAVSDESYQALTDEIAGHPERLYVIHGAMISHLYYYNHPVRTVLTTDTFRNIARTGSWDSFSVRYFNQVSRYIDEPESLLLSMRTDPDVRYVDTDAGLISAFWEEHTGLKSDPEVQSFDAIPYKIYDFSV